MFFITTLIWKQRCRETVNFEFFYCHIYVLSCLFQFISINYRKKYFDTKWKDNVVMYLLILLRGYQTSSTSQVYRHFPYPGFS